MDKLRFFSPNTAFQVRHTEKPFHFTPYIGIYARQTDGEFTFHFILQIGIYAWQTNVSFHALYCRFRQNDKLRFVSPSYWNQSMTDRWTLLTPHIVIYVIERKTNELHFVSPSCWDQSKTDGHIFFIPHIESTSDIRTNYVWFHSSYLNLRKTDGETTFHSLLIKLFESKADRGTNYVSFHPSYWDPSKTDGQTQLHFTPQNGIHVRQTDKLSFISPLILESKTDRRAHYVLFYPLFWDPIKTSTRINCFISLLILGSKSDGHTDKQHFISSHTFGSKKDGQTSFEFHPSCLRLRKTDGQTTFHFTPLIGIPVWQTDRHFISPLILGFLIHTYKLRFVSPSNWNLHKTDRRTNYVSFHSCWDLSETGRQTHYILFHPQYWNPSKKDKLSNISSLILESKHGRLFHVTPYIGIYMQDRLTNYVSFHPHWNPSKTDGQTYFHFAPHVCVSNRRTNVIFHSIYWHPSTTVRLTRFHFYPYIGIQVRQTDKLLFIPQIGNEDRWTNYISPLILESTQDQQTDTLNFTHYVGIYDDRQMDVSFHSSYLEPSKRDRQKHFISLVIFESKKDKLRFL